MNTLFALLRGFFNWIWWAISESFRFARESLSGFWALVLIIAGLIFQAGNFVIKLINLVIEKVTAMDLGQWDFAAPMVGDTLAIANTFFPLDEALGLFVLYCSLRILLAIYRFVKSFIPYFNGV